jgi:hypothetical protein
MPGQPAMGVAGRYDQPRALGVRPECPLLVGQQEPRPGGRASQGEEPLFAEGSAVPARVVKSSGGAVARLDFPASLRLLCCQKIGRHYRFAVGKAVT